MAKKGQNFRMMVKIGSTGTAKCVAAATDCSYHVGTKLEDASTKDSTGNWESQECVGKNWDCQVSALVIDDSTGVTVDELLAAVGTEVDVSFVETEGNQNRTAKTGKTKVGGKAILSDLTRNAPNQQNQTFSAQFTGKGEFGTVS